MIQACRPGMFEYELEAIWRYSCHKQGLPEVAYPAIVAAGANACVLHYTANQAKIQSGDCLLVDAGAEYQGYAADITRCFPANGRFSPEQLAIYELVLETQQAVIEAIKPGLPWDELQNIAAKTMTQGLIKLGILKGSLSSLLKKKAYQRYYMHNIGHWLGLDVHDVGTYREGKNWRALKPGMVFTVEPGCYINANDQSVEAKWRGIGIRIEDDLLLTSKGPSILTKDLPRDAKAIEQMMLG